MCKNYYINRGIDDQNLELKEYIPVFLSCINTLLNIFMLNKYITNVYNSHFCMEYWNIIKRVCRHVWCFLICLYLTGTYPDKINIKRHIFCCPC